MAYINVAEWSPDQVTDWLKGLDNDNSMYHYIQSFTNNEVRGHQMLNIRPYELEELGMYSIGHQEIVLEAVEHLRNFHYHLDKENLQFLALQIATASQCLHNQLARFTDKNKIETQILSDVARTIATIKPLIGWLDRAPFHRINRFVELRNKMLRFAIEMATMAQRDRFVENPVDQIKQTALRVAKLANYIVQDVSDVMILQPATLNLVTLKKKESELGFNIMPSYHGIHVITDIKYNSPAHTTGKIEEGDEIVQINYQTVVGWHYKKVIRQLHKSPPDIILTLKKRPKHSKIYGQIYMKPYRLPSKKKAPTYRWGGADALPSPRMADLLMLPAPPTKRDVAVAAAGAAASAAFPMPDIGQTVVVLNGSAQTLAARRYSMDKQAASIATTATAAALSASNDAPFAGDAPNDAATSSSRVAAAAASGNASDSEDDCSDIMTPTDRKASAIDLRFYLPKPRAVLQRRNTICGDRVSGFKGHVTFWHEYKDGEADSPSLRDKSVSFGFGLENATRPSTSCHIGMAGGGQPMTTTLFTTAEFGGLKGSLPDIMENGAAEASGGSNRQQPENVGMSHVRMADGYDADERTQGVSKVVRFDSSQKCDEYIDKDSRYACNVDNTILEVFEPIPYVDDEEESLTPTASSPPVAIPCAVTQQVPNGGSDRPNGVDSGLTQAVNEVLVRREIEKWEQKTGGISKGYQDNDIPPAIEPRIEFLHKTPPAPPPRPRKLSTIPSSTSTTSLSSSASFHAKPTQTLGQHHTFATSSPNPLPSTLPKPSPRHLHISEPIRDHKLLPLPQQHVPLPPAIKIAPQPIYNSQQQLQLSESFLQPDPNNDLPEYNNTPFNRSLRAEEKFNATATSTSALAAVYHNEPATGETHELVMPHKIKNLTLKKKNSIMAKRRNITLKTLEVNDIQGHLYRRTKDKHGVTYWAKLYMVLTDTSLYGFRSKDSEKADCLIFLNGFTVSLANEVHSKPFAFKVYHPSKTFYFAAESQMALAQWIEYIRKATLKGSAAALDARQPSENAAPVNMRELFSETESSDGESDFGPQAHKMLGTPSPSSIGRFGHKKSFCGSNASNLNAGADEATGPSTASTSKETPAKEPSKYHLGFGSLKKFSWPSSASKAAKAEKKLAASHHSDVPVPTAQFRSYRKVPGNAGLQLGTNSMISSSPVSALAGMPLSISMPLASTATDFSAPLNATPTNVAACGSVLDFHTPTRCTEPHSTSTHSVQKVSVQPQLSLPTPPAAAPSVQSNIISNPNAEPPPSVHTATIEPMPEIARQRSHAAEEPAAAAQSQRRDSITDSTSSPKLRRYSPYNYIHASNPNLVEFEFPAKELDAFSFSKVHPSNGWDSAVHTHQQHGNSLQGFVTLQDLMLQKQEEEAKKMVYSLVTQGVEKKHDPAKAAAAAAAVKLAKQQAQSQSRHQHSGRRSQVSINAALAAGGTDGAGADPSGSQYGGSTTGSERYNKIQNRSLPKTPDYAQSFKPDDRDIIMTRSREGQKLRDFGYEFISGDDGASSTATTSTTNRRFGAAASGSVASGVVSTESVPSSAILTISAPVVQPPPKKKSGLHWIHSSSDRKNAAAAAAAADYNAADAQSTSGSSRAGSIKKSKNKLMADTLETFKTSSEKLFQFKHNPQRSTGQQQPPTPPEKPHKPSYMPLTLQRSYKSPQPQPATHVYNMHGAHLADDGSSTASGTGCSPFRGSVKKSLPYNNIAEEQTPSQSHTHHNHASPSMFTKLSFGGSGMGSSSANSSFSSNSSKTTTKEKKLLGSPRLHRAIFGQSSSGRREPDVHSLDHEPFQPMDTKFRPNNVHEHDSADIAPTQMPPPTPHRMPHMPEYPNLEYPPVFEAETYSLNDPNASLTLLRRRNNPNNRSK